MEVEACWWVLGPEASWAWAWLTKILALLGQMSQDRLAGIWAIAGHVRVGQAIERVAVARFDSIKPRLIDRKAKAGMVEANQGTNAGEIHAARVKSCARDADCQGHGLSGTV
jgi:hypothetical protein